MPDSLLLLVVVGCLCGAAIAEARRIRHEHHPPHIDGWWHELSNIGTRWMPQTWRDACDESARKSRERRHLDDH